MATAAVCHNHSTILAQRVIISTCTRKSRAQNLPAQVAHSVPSKVPGKKQESRGNGGNGGKWEEMGDRGGKLEGHGGEWEEMGKPRVRVEGDCGGGQKIRETLGKLRIRLMEPLPGFRAWHVPGEPTIH